MLIEFYGITQDIAGCDSMEWLAPADTEVLMRQLKKQYPAIEELPIIFAVNNQIVSKNTPLKASDNVAVMPPFSGG